MVSFEKLDICIENLTYSFYKECFISGLKEEIQAQVRMQCSTTWLEWSRRIQNTHRGLRGYRILTEVQEGSWILKIWSSQILSKTNLLRRCRWYLSNSEKITSDEVHIQNSSQTWKKSNSRWHMSSLKGWHMARLYSLYCDDVATTQYNTWYIIRLTG